jgi:hypothetical protein
MIEDKKNNLCCAAARHSSLNRVSRRCLRLVHRGQVPRGTGRWLPRPALLVTPPLARGTRQGQAVTANRCRLHRPVRRGQVPRGTGRWLPRPALLVTPPLARGTRQGQAVTANRCRLHRPVRRGQVPRGASRWGPTLHCLSLRRPLGHGAESGCRRLPVGWC